MAHRTQHDGVLVVGAGLAGLSAALSAAAKEVASKLKAGSAAAAIAAIASGQGLRAPPGGASPALARGFKVGDRVRFGFDQPPEGPTLRRMTREAGQ